jgi:C1A family cysteine protease
MKIELIGIVIVMLLIGTALTSVGLHTESMNEKDVVITGIDKRCNECNLQPYGLLHPPVMDHPIKPVSDGLVSFEPINVDLPDYFNWKDHEGQDWTTSAKHQHNCGSCWDFAALGALEAVINVQEGMADLDPDLSEQYVLSCLPYAANNPGQGCLGGNPANAYKWILKNTSLGNDCNGIIFESCMPYQASHNIPCEEKCENWENYLVPLVDWGEYYWLNHEESTLDQIKTKIMENGPVAAGMNVTSDFQDWGWTHHEDTDYYPETHEKWSMRLNHVIVILGWKDDSSIGNGGYWICKNSWGERFGYDGFFNIEYGALFTGWSTAWAEYDSEDFDWPPIPKIHGPYYGDYYALINEAIEFQGDAMGEHPPFEYHWDFGDDTTSEEQNPSHKYVSSGKYTVKLTATDVNDNSFYVKKYAWIQETNDPPAPPIIEGPSELKKGEYCWYNFSFSDPDGNSCYLYAHVFGLESGVWWGPYPANYGIQNINYFWEEEGDYIVKAKVKDTFGAESDWTVLEVTVSKSKSINTFNPWFSRLIERFPILELLL